VERLPPDAPVKQEEHILATILVIEDDHYIQAMLSDLLEEEGYRVVLTGNGVEGLELLGSRQVDLVLCDLMMPGLDGRELRQAMQARAELAHIPVVLISATNQIQPDDTKAFSAVLRKPFQIEQLLRLVERLLPNHQVGA
jgi:CheY-like chemotaxis protein